MRLKPGIWMGLSLLFFAAGLCLWRAGDRLAASRRASLAPSVSSVSSVSSVPSVPSVPSTPAVPPPAVAAPSYRLSNTPQSAAQLVRNPRAILLRNALIDTSRPAKLAIPEPLRSHGAPGSYLAQSDRPLNAEFYAALRRDGAEFVSYIPNNTALVRATAEAARAMLADRVFQAVLPYEPYFKLDESLLPAAVNGESPANNVLRVTVFPGQDAAAEQALAALGAEVTDREAAPFGSASANFIVKVPPDRLVAVAQLPQAQEIESFSPRYKKNDLTRVRLGVSADTVALTNDLGLTGTNIWMVLDDTGVDATHPDFAPAASRLAGLLTDPDGHGTHVAGTMIGGGNESATVTNAIPGSVSGALYSGMASQASLYVQGVDMFTGPYISDSYLQSNASFVLRGMAATNPANTALLTNGFINCLPWGYQSTVYDLSAASYDAATRNAEPGAPGEHGMLFVVAAGNGNQAAGSITSPGTMKNGITVGAIDSPRFITNVAQVAGTSEPVFQSETFDSNQVAPFSSAGNVAPGVESAGGRFKPDVVAPGVFTISTRAAGFQDPAEQAVLNYSPFPGQSVLPGQSNVYQVTILGGTTNVIIQVLPNAFSPIPFPTNLQIYFDASNPPQTRVTATNLAGLPVVTNPPATDCYVEIASPASQPWPVAYDLRVYAIQTNGVYQDYYRVLATQLNTNLLRYYRYESGTSMSAGAVSGMLALMQQYLKQTLGLTPSPALLKALLINGARPLNRQSDLNPAPQANLEGYGLPNLTNSIPVSLNGTNSTHSMWLFDQSPTNALQTGQWHNYTVSLAGNATNSPLRVTLVWTDPPGNPAAGLALVNNLDLVVTDGTGSNVFIGNDFQPGDIYTEPSAANNPDPSDTVNNVQNVFLDSFNPLTSSYTVSVRGARVNVNAATTQTNGIGQDYALVISSDNPTNSVKVTDNGTTNAPFLSLVTTNAGGQAVLQANWTNIAAQDDVLVTMVNNGVALLHQRVGANEPNTNMYPGGLYPAPGYTNGNLVQWHFFLFPNINYQTTNTTAFTNSSAGTNMAASFTNAIFATFLPPTLSVPNTSPANLSYPAAHNADLDLYVSTNPALFNLDTNALAQAGKSLGQGGSETVLMTNIASVPNFYIGVKSESQEGGDFAMFAALTTNFDSLVDDNPVTVSAYALPVAIPDSFDEGGPDGANAIAFVASPITVRKVVALVGIEHSNPADLYGSLSHNGLTAVPNHFTGAPGGFTNTYDDLPDGTANLYFTSSNGFLPGTTYVPPVIPSDGPPSLLNFVGQTGSGQWILNETDNVFTQTGMVTMLTLTLWPQPPETGLLDYTNVISNLPPNGSYYGYIDVPDDATNLNIAASFQGAGPVGIYLTNREVPNPGDYGTNVGPPGGSLNLSANAALNIDPLVSNVPPLSGGRWFYDITNESGVGMTNIIVVVDILISLTPNLTVTESNNTPAPLGTDEHTISRISITNGVLSSNQQLVSLQVGVRLNDPNLDNLVLHLISPQGTSVLLFEDRGGPLATNLGLTTTNGYVYLTFTDNPILAPDLIKFVSPPFGQLPTNENVFVSSFETNAGDYGQSNALLPPVLGAELEDWTVASNDVAVVTGSDLYPAYDGTNYLALSSGLMTTTIPTVIGQPYTLTYAYRGPGLVDWWPFEGDATDLIGTNNGTLVGGPVTYVTGEVGLGVQFPGTNITLGGSAIDFGPTAGNVGTNDFTIDYWMNTSNAPPGGIESFLAKRAVCGVGNSLDITVGHGNPPTPGILTFGLRDDFTAGGIGPTGLLTTNKLNDSQWHHVAWVRRTNPASSTCTLLVYVDGKLNNTASDQVITYVTNSTHLVMGQNVCDWVDGSVPYGGKADELDLWNRALTDVEIAALYQAGTNHIGKADPTSIQPNLPNAEILLNGLTNTTLIASNASGANWLTNTLYFTAVNSNTTLALQGHPLGMLFDDFVLQTPADLNYVQPEEPLAPFTGQNPYGVWTLDVWDTRADSSAPTNGILLSWNLQMTVSSTNVNLIVLSNHVPTNGLVPANGIAYFAFDVPAGANFVANSLQNDTTNLSLLFSQTGLPTGTQLGDYTLLTNVLSGTNVLGNNTPPPSFLPGARYFLGVQNPNSGPAAFTIEVGTQTNAATVTFSTSAVAVTGMSVGANGLFTLQWTAAPGGQYEVDTSSDLIHWTKAAAITAAGSTATYTDPTPYHQSAARFYQVIRTQ
jgi:subtilisin-like proprotein convertase family protein